MIRLWRISNYANLDGAGGLHHAGRCHRRGRPVIYCAQSPAGALTEMLVHLDREELPGSFQLLEIEVSEPCGRENVDGATLAEGWQKDIAITQDIGDAWLARGASLLLDIPSALVPFTWNVLLNPLHRDMQNVSIISATHVPLDVRFS